MYKNVALNRIESSLNLMYVVGLTCNACKLKRRYIEKNTYWVLYKMQKCLTKYQRGLVFTVDLLRFQSFDMSKIYSSAEDTTKVVFHLVSRKITPPFAQPNTVKYLYDILKYKYSERD